MRKKIMCCIILFLILIQFPFLVKNVSADLDYSFKVKYENLNVTMNADGSSDYHYKIKFYCSPNGDPIDIVDIYMPNGYYKLSTARAKIDGRRSSVIYEE